MSRSDISTKPAQHHIVPANPEQRKLERALTRLDRLARLMDDQFEIPIVRVRVGLDPIIGLIPGGGDWVTWVVTMYILLEALRLHVPLPILLKIGWNATADLILGYVPGVGDVADIWFKANRRSVKLLMEWFDAEQNPRARDMIVVPKTAVTKPKAGASRWIVGAVLVLVLTAFAALPWVLIWWVFFG